MSGLSGLPTDMYTGLSIPLVSYGMITFRKSSLAARLLLLACGCSPLLGGLPNIRASDSKVPTSRVPSAQVADLANTSLADDRDIANPAAANSATLPLVGKYTAHVQQMPEASIHICPGGQRWSARPASLNSRVL